MKQSAHSPDPWDDARDACRAGFIGKIPAGNHHRSVSVVIPAYNLRNMIGDAIQSAQCQTIKPDEIIVADDGSTDGTAEFAESLGATVLRGPKANGNVARNRGLRQAKGEIVFFLDGDDWWHPQKVETHLLAHATLPEASVVFDPAIVVENGVVGKSIIGVLGDQRPSWERFLDWRCWASGSSFSIDRRRFSWDGDLAFNEKLIALQDVDFWIRTTYRFGPAYRLPSPFTYYRISPRSVSRKPTNVSRNLEIALAGWPLLSDVQRNDFRRQTFLTAARFCGLATGCQYLRMAGWPVTYAKFWKSLVHMTANSLHGKL